MIRATYVLDFRHFDIISYQEALDTSVLSSINIMSKEFVRGFRSGEGRGGGIERGEAKRTKKAALAC